MKVYIVYGYTPYGGEETFGVYSSQALADFKIEELQLNRSGGWEYYESYEMEVDK